jgi:hypothetical protein
MLRTHLSAVCLALVVASPALAAENRSIPNFAADSRTGWIKTPGSDEFIQPPSGPGPVQDDPTMPYVSNGHPGDGGDPNGQETVKIADVTNPILQPWAREQMRKANEEVRAGKIGFTARARCWPAGVPGFLTYPVNPIYIIQSEREVLMFWGQDFQLRRVHLNVPHSPNPRPSWYGESVGHYENGDTLVIDTIGLRDDTWIDWNGSVLTEAAKVREEIRRPDFGHLEIRVTVDDPKAYTRPWTVTLKQRIVVDTELIDEICLENEKFEEFVDRTRKP